LVHILEQNLFLEDNDAFNFYVSQFCICIEMAFGIMVTNWRILKAPLMIKLENIPYSLGTIARLHNYSLRNGEVKKKMLKMYFVPSNMQLPHAPQTSGYVPTDAPNVTSKEGASILHNILCKCVYKF
jgi:hypothetical protein